MANQAVSYCLDKKSFITLAYVMLDFETNELSYSRAGHCPMMYYRAADKQLLTLEDKGMGLGIVRNMSYVQFIGTRAIALHPNDLIILYTDGLVESRNEEGEYYGYERLQAAIERYAEQDIETTCQTIYDDFMQFTASAADRRDDTSLLIIKIKENV